MYHVLSNQMLFFSILFSCCEVEKQGEALEKCRKNTMAPDLALTALITLAAWQRSLCDVPVDDGDSFILESVVDVL